MTETKELDFLMKEYANMGYTSKDILDAYLLTNRKALFYDYLTSISANRNSLPPVNKRHRSVPSEGIKQLDESELEKFIQELTESRLQNKNFIPNEMKREGLTPVLITGNCSYLSMLLQTLFQVKEFVLDVMRYKEPKDFAQLLTSLSLKPEIEERKNKTARLVKQLKEIYGLAIFGNRKSVDISKLLSAIPTYKGEELIKDGFLEPSEFCINLLERISEGLCSTSLKRKSSLELESFEESQCGSLIADRAQKIADYMSADLTTNENVPIEETEDLNELFFGKTKDYITFEWDEYKTKKGQDCIFGPINLNIKYRTLPRALENYFNSAIEGFQASNSETINAKKRSWVLKAPKILCFNLQNIEYDPDEERIKRNLMEFDIDLEISLDKYLYSNKLKIEGERGGEGLMKFFKKEKRIEKELNDLKNFEHSGSGTSYILGNSIKFIKIQLDEIDHNDFVSIDDVGDVDERICHSKDKSELESAMQILKDCEEEVGDRIAYLEERRNEIKNKIEAEISNLNHVGYKLFSVIINANSHLTAQHFFAYIKNFDSNTWFRISDSQMSEVKEEEVLAISKGEHLDCSVFQLFYIRDDTTVHNFNESELRELALQFDEEIDEYVKKENHKFEIECTQFNSGIIKTIYNEYVTKMNKLRQEADNFLAFNKKKTFPNLPHLPPFNVFLLLDLPKTKEIASWRTLYDIVSSSNIPYNILNGEKDNFYYVELEKLIVNKNCVSALSSLELNYQQNSLLVHKKNEYMNYLRSIILLKQTFNLVYLHKWKDAITAVAYINTLVEKYKIQEYNQWFFSFSSYLLVVLSLKICSLIDLNYREGNLKEMLELQKVMIHCLANKTAIKPPKIFYTQIINNMTYTYSLRANKDDLEPEMIIFKHMVSKLEGAEILTLGDVYSNDFKELLNEVNDIDKNEDFILSPTFPTDLSLPDLYNRSVQTNLQLWIEFEENVRRKGALIPQEFRVNRESYTFTSEHLKN